MTDEQEFEKELQAKLGLKPSRNRVMEERTPFNAALAAQSQREITVDRDGYETYVVDGVTFRRKKGLIGINSHKKLDNLPEECKNPELEYRFVDADKKGRINQLKELGYAEVNDPNLTNTPIRDGNKKGTQKMVLMATPKKFVEQRKAEKARKLEQQAEAMAAAKQFGSTSLDSSFFVDKMGRI